MSNTYEKPYSLDVNGFDFEILVTFGYTPGDPGVTSGPPERCYPPEPSEVEIESICLDNMKKEDIKDLSALLNDDGFVEDLEQAMDELMAQEEPDEGPEPDDDFDDFDVDYNEMHY